MEPDATEPSKEEMEQLASVVAGALGEALRRMDWECHPLPFLPLTIGVNRYKGTEYRFWAWDIRFTWMREDKADVLTPDLSRERAQVPLSTEQIEKLARGFTGALAEPLRQTMRFRQLIPYVPLFVDTRRYEGHVNTKHWWAWEIQFLWTREY